MLKPRWSIEQKRQYVAKTAVRGVSAMVWRRLRVAADTSLAALHFIIRIIQGWGMTTCTSFIFTVKVTMRH